MTRRYLRLSLAQQLKIYSILAKIFPQLQTFKLEQNYRSLQYIVNAAN